MVIETQTVEALAELRQLTGHSAYLFPGGNGRFPYISENTLNKAIAILGYKGRVAAHGFHAERRNDNGTAP